MRRNAFLMFVIGIGLLPGSVRGDLAERKEREAREIFGALADAEVSSAAEDNPDESLVGWLGLTKSNQLKVSSDTLKEIDRKLTSGYLLWLERREEVRKLYLDGLEELVAKHVESDRLKEAMAVREEMARIGAGQYANPERAGGEPEIKAIRRNFYTSLAENDAELASTTAEAIEEYAEIAKAARESLKAAGELERAFEMDEEIGIAMKRFEAARQGEAYLKEVAGSPVKELGARTLPDRLSGGLYLYYGFDSLENAGLSWSSESYGDHRLGRVRVREDGWRKYADFRSKQSYMKFEPKPVELGDSWTIACWLTLPNAGAHVLTMGGHPLIVQKNRFSYYQHGYKLLWAPKLEDYPKGWTHVGLTFEEGKLKLYVNGKYQVTKEADFGDKLRLLGNRPGTHGDWSMVHHLDDLMFFRRALGPLEMRDLCEWTSFAE